MRDNEQKNRNYGSDTDQNYQKITGNCHKLDSYNWLKDIPEVAKTKNIVEVRFKNTRKDFFRNVNELRLKTGDIVAVEASPRLILKNGRKQFLLKNQLC
jgi:hypothetical protein